jgi:hypothetical protein
MAASSSDLVDRMGLFLVDFGNSDDSAHMFLAEAVVESREALEDEIELFES